MLFSSNYTVSKRHRAHRMRPHNFPTDVTAAADGTVEHATHSLFFRHEDDDDGKNNPDNRYTAPQEEYCIGLRRKCHPFSAIFHAGIEIWLF